MQGEAWALLNNVADYLLADSLHYASKCGSTTDMFCATGSVARSDVTHAAA